MAFFEAGMGGSFGGSFRIRVNSDIIAQDEENNRTLIRYNAYIDRVSTSGGRIFNGFNTFGHTNLGDYGNPQRGPFHYDSTGVGRVITMAANEDRWYGHNSDGTRTIFQGADYNGDNAPYLTSGATGGNVGLPSYYRYADPTGIFFNNITDVSFDLRVTTNRVCSFLQVSINGGASFPYQFGGSFTDKTVTIGSQSDPLPSDAPFSVQIILRRQASGFDKAAGNWGVSTETQNKFFDLLGF
jgi:hypothetical protein